MKAKNNILSFILSLICIILIFLGNINNILSINNNITYIVYFIALFALFKITLNKKKYKKRNIIISTSFGLILALFMALGLWFLRFGTSNSLNKNLLLYIIALWIIFTAIINVIIIYFPETNTLLRKSDKTKILKKHLETPNLKTYLMFFITFVILWIPAFLALYPGYLSYDGPIQLDQVFLKKQLDAHHPVIHTIMLTGLINLGHTLFNSYSAGLAMYSIIQALIIAAIFAYLGIFLIKYKVPKILIIFSILFLAINPIIQIFVFTTTKDVLFGGFLLLTTILTIELIMKPKIFLNKKVYTITYIISIILMSLLKKQGIYIFIILIPILIWINRKNLIKITTISLISLGAVLIFYGPVSSLLNIVPGKPREMLSIPIQQMARVVNINPSSITEEEMTTLTKYMSIESMEEYIPQISDKVKDAINNEELQNDKLSFFKVWLSLGLKNPFIYVDAFNDLTLPYWYPNHEALHPIFGTLMYYYSPTSLTIPQQSLLPQYYGYLSSVGQNYINHTTAMALPLWTILLVTALLIRYRRYELLIPILIMILFFGSLILGPVACIRYIVPLLMCFPLILSLIFIKKSIKR